MPIISKEQHFFAGQPYLRVIKVDSRGTFSSEIPEFARDRLGISEVTAPTKDGVLKAISEASAKLQNMQSVTKKVILYNIKSSAYIWDDAAGCVAANHHDVSFSKGLAIDASAGVFEEDKLTTGDGKTRYTYKALDSKIPKGMQASRFDNGLVPGGGHRAAHQIDWTPEREDFFCKLGRAMEQIILSLKQLDKQSTLLALADNPATKLLGL